MQSNLPHIFSTMFTRQRPGFNQQGDAWDTTGSFEPELLLVTGFNQQGAAWDTTGSFETFSLFCGNGAFTPQPSMLKLGSNQDGAALSTAFFSTFVSAAFFSTFVSAAFFFVFLDFCDLILEETAANRLALDFLGFLCLSLDFLVFLALHAFLAFLVLEALFTFFFQPWVFESFPSAMPERWHVQEWLGMRQTLSTLKLCLWSSSPHSPQ